MKRVAVVLTILLALVALPAFADQITIGASTSGLFTFTPIGAGVVTVSTSGLSGQGFFTPAGSGLGSYTLGAVSFNAGPNIAEQYAAGANSESFSFTDGTNTVTGTIAWSFIQDNTTNPKFFGTLTVATVAGNAIFLKDFPVGSHDPVDLTTTALSTGGTLDALAAGRTAGTAGVSSGEVVPVPEPASMLLLGSGLVGLGGLIRKRIGR